MNIKETLAKHSLWGKQEEGGERANLSGADLSRADLSGANLSWANLSGAKDVFQFGPMPTSGRICIAIRHPEGWKVHAGCFWDYLPVLEERVKKYHNCQIYLAMIEVLKNM